MLNSINDVQTLIAGVIKPEHTVYLPNIIGVTQRDLKAYATKAELEATKESLGDYVKRDKSGNNYQLYGTDSSGKDTMHAIASDDTRAKPGNIVMYYSAYNANEPGGTIPAKTPKNPYEAANKKYVDGKLQYPSSASFSEVWADYLHAWQYLGVADSEGYVTEIFRPEGIEGDTVVCLPAEDGTLLTEEKADETYVQVDVITGNDRTQLYGRAPNGTVRGYALAAAINQSNNGWIPVYQSGTSDLIPSSYLYTGTPTRDGMAANKKYVDDMVSKGYRLIETITLTEDTQTIERSQEPDGTAYNFKDMFIAFSCTNDMPVGSVTNSKEWVKCWFNYGEKRFALFRETTLGRASNSAKYRSFIKTKNEGNLKRSIMTRGYINYGYSNSETQADGNLEWLFTTNNLTKIQLEHQSNFLAGIVIEIWATDV